MRFPLKRTGSKYRNRKTVSIDGQVFDSAHEARVWNSLIADPNIAVERQVWIPLQVNGQTVCHFVADFAYTTDDGEYVVADAKSKFTRTLPVYRLKRKLFKAQYGVDIVEL